MTKRTIIHGGILGTEDGAYQADLVIDGERISAIMLDSSDIAADERIDAAGRFVLPGAIDMHTHFKEPSVPLDEGFYNGSLGAIAGGITSIVEMPQASPTSSEGAHIRAKREIGETQSIVDFALWGAAINQDLSRIQEMIGEGVVGIKSFMAGSSSFFPKATDATLLDVFQLLAGTSIPYGLHAENDDLLQAGLNRLQQAGRRDPLAHAESRPAAVEVEAINRALYFAERTGSRVHICHCSTADGLRLIAQARARGVQATVETCPQYLALDEDDLVRLGPFGRCAPAIRSRAEVERLWDGLEAGLIDVLASDHCGLSVESKETGLDDIWQAPNGLVGVQTMCPVIFDEMINKRGLDVSMFVKLTAANPARIASLYPRKGVLRVGADADIAIYDPHRSWIARGSDMLHQNKWTPFEGREVNASVVATIRRGQVVYRNEGNVVVSAEAGSGRFLPRGYGQSGKV